MEQSISFHKFDQEQIWKHTARRRQAKGIKQINLPETQEWLFSTDLDYEIDQLLTRMETNQCH